PQFSDSALWILGTNLTIASNAVVASPHSGSRQITYRRQVPLYSGIQYEVTFTILDYVAGTCRPRFGAGDDVVDGSDVSGDGTHSQILTANDASDIRVRFTELADFKITNLS